MGKDVKIVRRAFNAGEVSSLFNFRNDVEKHGYACERLENFYVSPLGGISRREGTRMLKVLGEVSEDVRIIPFEFNRELSLALVFHSSDKEIITKKSEEFEMPSDFAMLLSFPLHFGDAEGEILRKGNLSITRRIGEEDLLIFSDDENMLSCAFEEGAEYVLVYENGVATLYKDNESVGSSEFSPSLERSPLYLYHYEEGLVFKVFNGNSASEDTIDFEVESYEADYSSTISKTGDMVEITAGDFEEMQSKAKENAQDVSFSHGYADWSYAILDNISKCIVETSWNESGIPAGNKIFTSDVLTSGQRIVLVGKPTESETGNLSLENFANYLNFSGDTGYFEYGTNGYATKEDMFNAVYGLATTIDGTAEVEIPFDVYGYVILTPTPATEGNSVNLKTCQFAKISEEIRVPFSVPQSYALDYEADYSAQGVSVSFETLSGQRIEAKSYNSLSEGISHVVFTLAHTANLTPCLSGDICLQAGNEFFGYLTFSESSEKVIYYDVYGIDGAEKQKQKSSPIPHSALQSMQFKQVGGDLYFCHPDFSPKKLSMQSDGSFVWSEAVEFQPSSDEPENVVLSCEASNEIILADEIREISASGNFFTQSMVGSQFKIDYSDDISHVFEWQTGYTQTTIKTDIAEKKPELFASFVTPVFIPCGEVTITPQGGIWDGVLVLEESTDNGKTWNEIGRTTSIQGSDNTSFIREVYDVKSLVRARMLEMRSVVKTSSTKIESANEGCFFTVSIKGRSSAWVEITGVKSAVKANARFINPCRASFSSTAVYKSAWQDDFPRAVEIHEERLCFAGTSRNPSTIWLSQTNNWGNFRSVSNLDTDPLSYTLASDDGEPISWLISRSDLMIGMGSSEWSFGSRDNSQALTSSIVHAASQSDDGVEYIMPAKAGGMVIFVRRGNRELASISYDFANDGYNAVSLCTMNPDILEGGVVSIFNQLSPTNKIYCVLKSGKIAVFTYDKENNVAAWGSFIFGDGVLSACAVSTGKFRSVFLIVKRGGYLCLERLDANEEGTNNWLDCVPIRDDLEIPEGLEASVRYESYVKTTPIFAEGNIQVLSLELMMLNSYGGKYRLSGWSADMERLEDKNDWRDITMKNADILANPSPRDYRFFGNCNSGFLEEAAIEVKTDEPSPFTLCAMAVKAEGF